MRSPGAIVIVVSIVVGMSKIASAAGTSTPVLVELFTSEGCSDCPPADRLLAALAAPGKVPGAEVIALEEHVDYWNHLGWRDPFSSALFSRRQSDYANAFRLDDVYTPEMVVDGAREFVGSDRDAAVKAVEWSAGQPHIPVGVTVIPTRDPGQIIVRAHVLRNLSAVVYVAITEDHLVSHVRAGENVGRTLAHEAVTRYLTRVDNGAVPGSVSIPITLPAAWDRINLRAVVFLQDPSTGRILGAGATPL